MRNWRGVSRKRYRVKLDLVAVGLDDPYTLIDSGQGEIVAMQRWNIQII